MASNIDITKPEAGTPSTASVRLNFQKAKEDIDRYLRSSRDYVVTTGTSTAYSADNMVDVTKTDGERVTLKAHTSNTGASTININSTGASSIKPYGADTLDFGMIIQDHMMDLMWDNTESAWVLLNPYPVGANKFNSNKTITLDGAVTGSVTTNFSSNPTITTTLSNSGIVDVVYPVGSIYMSTLTTNPETIFSGTTWAAIQAETVLTTPGGGINPGQYGGDNDVTLTTNELPAHTHGEVANVSTTDQGRDGDSGSSIVGLIEGDRLGGTTGSTGSGNSFSIKQKGYGVYMWRRLT